MLRPRSGLGVSKERDPRQTGRGSHGIHVRRHFRWQPYGLSRGVRPHTDIFEDVEPFDVDLGLTLRKYGLNVFLEPRSVATYSALPAWEVRDIPLFKFRWDPASWEARNRLFMQKWGVTYDSSSKLASYRRQQLRLGFARWYPNIFTVGLSNVGVSLEKRLLSLIMPGVPHDTD